MCLLAILWAILHLHLSRLFQPSSMTHGPDLICFFNGHLVIYRLGDPA
jgi:hypothetical protein